MRTLWASRALLVLLLAASIAAGLRNLRATTDLGSVSDDPVADWEERFAVVKERLPFERGFVGYISDSDIPGASFDPANDEGEYVLTQYAMAPVTLVRGTAEEWSIANLSIEAFRIWSSTHSGFEVVPLRNRLYLLHRITK